VVWCVSVVVAGDGDDDRMGLLGETVERCLVSSCSLARSSGSGSRPSAEAQPGMRCSSVACLPACLPAFLRRPVDSVSILILRVYVVDYCSVRGVLFSLGRHGKCILSHDSSRVLMKGQQSSQAGPLSQQVASSSSTFTLILASLLNNPC